MNNLQPDRLAKIPCAGGCDFVTPILEQRPGFLRMCQNLEIDVTGGYKTIAGYERYDGRTSPSAATYTVLASTITGTIATGNTVTGGTSGATGVVIVVEASAVIVTKVTGTFVSGETLLVSAAVQATTTAAPETGMAASTPALHRSYLTLAAAQYQADIAVVPGAGPIRGICRYNGVLYAWRNNVGNTAMAIYKSTGSGYSAVALGRELSFTSGGTTEITQGQTITGATSGATAVLTRVTLESGTWAGGDAAGRFIFASQTGTFQAENINIGAAPNLATIAGNSSAITLAPSGRVRHFIHNFGGSTGTRRIYGCDGVNRGFEFDGTVFVPIRTGMTTDTPDHVICHKQHLFFSFGASVQFSSTNRPYAWSVVLGAGEIGAGDNVTGFSIEMGSEAGGALGIMSRNTTHILYGSDTADFQLVRFRDEIGAFSDTAQSVGSTIRVDDRGVVSLQSTANFGNFQGSTLSQRIQPWIQDRKTLITDTCVVREKNQYRIYFSDNTALYATISNNKVLGMMTQLLDHQVLCIHSVELSTGGEEIFFGCDDGYCYQMDSGTSFDGGEIESFGLIQYYNCGTPRVNKRYKSATVEATGDGYTEFYISYELDYGSVNQAQPEGYSNAASANFQEGRWDSFRWDYFYWDGEYVSPMNFDLAGCAENIGFIFYKSSDAHLPTKISGIVLRYQLGRILR